MADTDGRIKVAILGSGCGAMSAAFWLSATRELREKYAVTVYTQGWRLGGKGASGRSLVTLQNGGRSVEGSRIEEHGLHMMMGFYETAFHVIQSCYERIAWEPDAAFTRWNQAFEAQRQITLMLRKPGAEAARPWRPWNLRFIRLPGTPGDERLALEPRADYMAQAVHRVLELLVQRALRGIEAHFRAHSRWSPVIQGALAVLLDGLENLIERRLDYEAERHRQALLELLLGAQSWFIQYVVPLIRNEYETVGLDSDPAFEAYCLFLVTDMGFAGMIGYLKDVLPYGEGGYQRIGDRDFKDWLLSHGAQQETVHSGLVMGLYDLAFAYENGNSSDPRFGKAAAGAMLRLVIRMAITYKDAPLWKMNAGMGDVIFTPLYKLLSQNGVRFEFFHRVGALHLSGDKKSIDSIELLRQARVNGDYQPLQRFDFRNGKQWDCWPSTPRWDQIEGGKELVEPVAPIVASVKEPVGVAEQKLPRVRRIAL